MSRTTTHRSRSGALLAVIVVLLAALMGACADAAGGTGRSTISYNGTEPENPLIPGDTTETGGIKVIGALFRGLVEYDPRTAQPRNAVAEAIETTDSRFYTITLRPGWTFHDGSAVTANSFVDAWNYTAYAPNRQHGASFLSHIEGFDQVNPPDPDGSGPLEAPAPAAREMSGLRVVDERTFLVTLREPFSAFATQLGYAAFFPLPVRFFTDRAGFEAHPIGNGPFEFVSRIPGKNIVLTRNEDFAGVQKPHIGGVEFRFYATLEDAYAAVVADRLDFLEITPASALAGGRYRSDLAGRHLSQTYLGVQSMSFPLYDPRFADPRLRQAISMSIDRQAVIDQVFGGDKQVADGLVPPNVPGRIDGQCGDLCIYQPERARQLFDATGFVGPIELTSNNDSANQQWMEAVCASIAKSLGRDCRFVPVATLGDFRRAIDDHEVSAVYRSGWVADYPSIENFLAPMYRTGAAVNGGLYSNPTVDALLARADAAGSEHDGWALYQEAERTVLQDMPAIPLWFQTVQSGWSTRLHDVIVTPFRELDLYSVTTS